MSPKSDTFVLTCHSPEKWSDLLLTVSPPSEMSDLPAYSPRALAARSTISVLSAPPSYLAHTNDPTASDSPWVRTGRGGPSATRPASRPSSSSRPSYTIGRKQTPALVAATDLKAHLVILRAFYQLREQVQFRAGKSSDISDGILSPEQEWQVFLSRAAWRFELWLKRVVHEPPSNSTRQQGPSTRWSDPRKIPPVDVLMVWHSYLLHPRTYLEDGLRYNAGLLYRGSFPLHEVASMIETEDPLSPGTHAHERARYWESLTGQPWQPLTSLNDGDNSMKTIPLQCPGCAAEVHAPWIADDERGWAQTGFRAPCTSCGMHITKEAMGILKFAEDLRKVVEEPKRRTLATVLLDEETGKPSIAGALIFNQNLVEGLHKASFIPNARAYAAQELQWNPDKVSTRCRTGFLTTSFLKRYNKAGEERPGGLQRMMEAYTTPGPYSVDLVKAVQRQMKFVDSIVSLGWTDHGRFESENDVSNLTLKRAVTQYHGFLDVMAVNPDAFLVPTLSIDLAWHTHQLLCVEYRENTMSLLGTIVNHDDAVEQEALAEAFDQTARLWLARFSIPYTICGCPTMTSSTTTSSKPMVGAVTKLFGRKGKAKDITPEVQNHRPDLLSHRGDDVFETHPSEHSEVNVINSPSARKMALARGKAINKRLQEDQDAVSSGGADGWQALLVEIRSRPKDGHHSAFSESELKHTCDQLDVQAAAMGQCAMGLGSLGKCVGGNTMMRARVVRDDSVSNHINHGKGSIHSGPWG